MTGIFLNSLIIGYSGALMPGSLLTYTIDKSVKRGAKAGLIISLGHSVLELFLVVILLQGVGSYLKTDLARVIIGLAGGCLLAFFGITMIRDSLQNRLKIDFEGSGKEKQGNMFLGGVVISASNPYFIFWWAAIGLGLITASYNSFGILGVAVFYIGHIITDISWYSFISIAISKTRKFFNMVIYRVVIAVLGAFMLFLACKFIIGSIRLIPGL